MKQVWALVCLLLGAGEAAAQVASVVEVRRIGSNVEDIAVIDSGRFSGAVALLDGDELRFVDPSSTDPAVLRCDLTDAGVITDWTPRGIAWLSRTREFVVHDLFPPFHAVPELIFFDESCANVRRVEVVYPAGFQIGNTEGMDYIPASSPRFKNHFASIVDDESFQARIVIYDLDGVVVDIIEPAAPVGLSYGLGLAYADGGFLVTVLGADETWRVEFDGSVSLVAGQPIAGQTEGLDRLRNGDFIGADYRARVRRTDRDLALIPGSERSYVYAPNIPRALGAAHQDGRFIFRAGLFAPQLNATQDTFTSNLFLVTLPDGAALQPAPIGGTRTIVVSYPQDRAIQLYDDLTATLHPPVDVSASFPDADAGPPAFADSTGEVFMPERGPLGRHAVLQVVQLDGTPVREIDLEATLGVTFVDTVSWRASASPSGELVVFAHGQIWLTDLDGQFLAVYDLPAGVALNQVSAVNDGIYAGLLTGMELLDTNRLFLLAL